MLSWTELRREGVLTGQACPREGGDRASSEGNLVQIAISGDRHSKYMGKVCIACGDAPLQVKKSGEEAEDCENCGKNGTVQKTKADESESGTDVREPESGE